MFLFSSVHNICMLASYLGNQGLHSHENGMKRTNIIFQEHFILWLWSEDATVVHTPAPPCLQDFTFYFWSPGKMSKVNCLTVYFGHFASNRKRFLGVQAKNRFLLRVELGKSKVKSKIYSRFYFLLWCELGWITAWDWREPGTRNWKTDRRQPYIAGANIAWNRPCLEVSLF